jgi:RNA recognition motif-containing protein
METLVFILIENINLSETKEDVSNYFKRFGEIKSVQIINTLKNQESIGQAVVQMN